MPNTYLINLLFDHPDWQDQASAFEAAVTVTLRATKQWWAPGRRLQASYGDERGVEFGPFVEPSGEQRFAWGRTPAELAHSLRELLEEAPVPTR